MNARTDPDAPLCECGCGEYVKSAKNGIWSRWRPGHSSRKPGAPVSIRTQQRRQAKALAESEARHPSGATGTQLALWPEP